MIDATVALACALMLNQPDLPIITIDRDNVEIDRSCRVVVPEGVHIVDADGNGVVHVTASGITIEGVEGQAELIQHPDGTPWETIEGIGWRLDGVSDVTLRNIHAHRFKVGILATRCDGLVLEGCDVSGGYAMRLGSTPQAEDSADWLWPHENDDHEWRQRYGAGICVESSEGVTIRDCFARRRQNGIILDRVSDSSIYDNDMSFLSGWGLAMWRSSRNTISRNAFDFCIRGYSHGVYNRGQDSAGILMFEQCSGNVIAENSCTHSGDGIFAFAGRDALGEGAGEGVDPAAYERRGNNDNLFVANDLSHAAAHGLELTFSFGNRVFDNLFEGNAICGIWGGYSQETLVARNRFEGNGHMGYGLERGGVNIEHGAHNTIRNNTFRENRAGIHLWTDEDAQIRALPWAKANYRGAVGNLITENRFEGDEVAIHLRQVEQTAIFANAFVDVGEEIRIEGSVPIVRTGVLSSSPAPRYAALGESRPVGARDATRGGRFIVMGEYFPWDFRSPMLRFAGSKQGGHFWDLFALDGVEVKVRSDDAGDSLTVQTETVDGRTCVTVRNDEPGVHPYRIEIWVGDDPPIEAAGTIINAAWEVLVFPWTVDPREDLGAWRQEARDAPVRTIEDLRLRYGHGGPSDLGLVAHGRVGVDRFGTIARTRLRMPAGRWRLTTLSDDGVRVLVDGRVVIENWTWHAPTRDVGVLEVDRDREVEIVVEHFELDGYSVLELEIEPER